MKAKRISELLRKAHDSGNIHSRTKDIPEMTMEEAVEVNARWSRLSGNTCRVDVLNIMLREAEERETKNRYYPPDERLTEYERVKGDAERGIGTPVSHEKMRNYLTLFVDSRFEAMTDAEMEFHAIGGGYVVETRKNFYLMPLWTKDGKRIFAP